MNCTAVLVGSTSTQTVHTIPLNIVITIYMYTHVMLFPFVQLVAGSAVMAFEDVCPDRIDLIHKNYRKLCNLLIDIDEWGQVAVIHMLTRYARTQFIDPNKGVRISSYQTIQTALKTSLDRKYLKIDFNGFFFQPLTEGEFYPKSDNSDDDDDDSDDETSEKKPKKQQYIMDPDHRLLLRTCKPLLQSRNAAVSFFYVTYSVLSQLCRVLQFAVS